MASKGTGTALIITGASLGFFGLIGYFAGNSMDGDYGRQLESIFNSGSRDQTGSVISGLSVAAIIVGVILVITGILIIVTAQPQVKTPTGTPYHPNAYPNPQMGSLPQFMGIYTSADKKYALEFISPGMCIWRQENELYNGTYRMCAPNQYEIIMEGFGRAFVFYPVDSGIQVNGGPVNEVLYFGG